MSAYIVEPRTIDKIITHMVTNAGSYAMEPMRQLCYPIGNAMPVGQMFVHKMLTELGKHMMALNKYSVQCRYPNCQGTAGSDCVATYNFSLTMVTRVQAYKALRCFLYQSCEGDAPEFELFQALDEMSKRMAVEIVETLSSFQDAQWG